jgi:RecQ family ATP-dependent DNA helicase
MTVTAPADSISSLLHRTFGFATFRANQEAVCRAAVEGRDVLLVMPTGSGKSLCYQLPAIVRGGTALVVSPLIALMDDQAAKLSALGLSVARIHSGLDRTASRQACIDYLKGNLQFLFIAPERLRVPGFPEMLARRKPSLIAIDEAHCISQWGHDFRPDYRMLGQYLPALRPAPVIALTATATPIVQNDIAAQLGLASPARFIHGFRRDNLAIEVIEVSRPRRAGLALELLSDSARRPAIIYAPARKEAEALAAELSAHFPAAAYHAGLAAAQREQTQRDFLDSRLEVIVATIAFGMGIDKPDVRTVIHTALPASLEAYYQEIGRAGRDGKPSRTILLHSYADRRAHDFFFERDYPAVEELERVYRRLAAEPQPIEALRAHSTLDPETFDKVLEKLAIHGGATVDYSENVVRGHDRWRSTYKAQYEQRRGQIDLVMRYAQGHQCRMAALIRHFGDTADGRHLCGRCDFCSPEQCVAQRFREANDCEQRAARDVLRALRQGSAKSTGRLHQDLCPSGQPSRDGFELLLGAMASAGMIELEDTEFEKDGRIIPYRKVSITAYGEELEDDVSSLLLRDDSEDQDRAPAPRKRVKAPAKAKREASHDAPLTAAQSELESRLKAWRLAEATRLRVPAFCVLGNKVLRALAQARPTTSEELLAIDGIGPAKVQRFGEAICNLCSQID